ncbi:MAG TPA: hypothetical protein ENK60_05380 [Anaerolineae bacterium]|nr:hypothetical protein [Anaerolineae bacterium]
MTPTETIAIIDADIRSGEDELAREQVLARLHAFQDASITPLWVNWLRARADLRVVCMVHDLTRLDDFLIDVLREARGVIGTRAVLSFGGRADINRLLEIPMAANGQLDAANVRIKLAPGRDREAFDAIWGLPDHPQVKPVWLLRTYHGFNADLNMLLFSESHPAINGYITSWLRPVEGLIDTQLCDVIDWHLLASPDQMIQLAERFFEFNREESNG